MTVRTNQEYLRTEQYKDASNLEARKELHQRFSTNTYPWHRWVFDHLDVPANARVLELGCGPAWLWVENEGRIPQTWEVTLSDFSEGMLAEAKRNVQGLNGSFSFRQLDAQNIPFDDASFDAVIANHMLYHVPDIPKALVEIRRVLKPGGRLYAATNGAGHLQELGTLQARLLGREPKRDYDISGSRRFGLQNGAALLEPFFPHVTLYRFEGDLEVTEAEPLVAYILSMNALRDLMDDVGATDMDETAFEEKVAAFREYLVGRLEAEGSIHIGKETGLFEAS